MALETPATDAVTTEVVGKEDPYDESKGEELANWCFGLLEHNANERRKQTRETKWQEDWRFVQGDQWEAPRPSYKRAIVMNAWRRSFHIVLAVITGGRPTLKIVPQGIIPTQSLKIWQDALWAQLRKEAVIEQKYAEALTWAWVCDGGWLKVGYGKWAEVPGELPDVLVSAPHPTKVYPDGDCTDVTLTHCHNIIFRETLDIATITDRYPSQGWRAKADNDVSSTWGVEAPNWVAGGKDTISPAGGWKMNRDFRRMKATVLEVWIDDPSLETFMADVIVGVDPVTMAPKLGQEKQWRKKYPYGRVITCTKDVILRDIPNPYGKAFGWNHRWPFVFVPGSVQPSTLWRPGLLSNKSETQRAINKGLSLLLENYIKCTAMLVVGDENAMEDEDWDMLSLVPGVKIRKRQGTELNVVFPQPLPPHAFTFPDYMKNKLEEEVGIHDPPIAPGQAVAAKTVAFMQQKGSFLLGILAKLGDEALERLGARVLGLMRDRYIPGQAIPYFEGEQTEGRMVEIPQLPSALQLRVEATSAYQEIMSSSMLLAQAGAQAQSKERRSR